MKRLSGMREIPTTVLKEITAAACEHWPSNEVERDLLIESEVRSYLDLQGVDFGPALSVKDLILRSAAEIWDPPGWSWRLNFVRTEIAKLRAMTLEDFPANVVSEARKMAEAEESGCHGQLEYVKRILHRYHDNQQTRAKVEPIRELLEKMEQIIGNNFYNDHIQNYESWGMLESTGRAYRYPVTFVLQDGTRLNRGDWHDDLTPEALITGHYKVGANEMNVYRALVAIVDLLQDEYGLQLQGASRTETPTS